MCVLTIGSLSFFVTIVKNIVNYHSDLGFWVFADFQFLCLFLFIGENVSGTPPLPPLPRGPSAGAPPHGPLGGRTPPRGPSAGAPPPRGPYTIVGNADGFMRQVCTADPTVCAKRTSPPPQAINKQININKTILVILCLCDSWAPS